METEVNQTAESALKIADGSGPYNFRKAFPADRNPWQVYYYSPEDGSGPHHLAVVPDARKAHAIARALNQQRHRNHYNETDYPHSKHNSKCLANAADDEPVFVLRGQDVSSPNVVMEWISLNINTAPPEKLREAFECVLEMQRYHNRKIAD